MTMLKLKSNMSPVSAAMFNVSVAGTIAPACSLAFSWFQVKNMLEVAVGGFQSVTVMLRISVMLPVFFM